MEKKTIKKQPNTRPAGRQSKAKAVSVRPDKGKKVFWIILALWCALTLICVVRPDRTYSAKEKRSLTTRESISPKKLAAGDLDQKVETYVTDQLPGRDGLIRLRSSFLLLTGNRYSQNVILGKQGQMMEAFEEPAEEQTMRTIDAIRRIRDMSGVPALVVTVPTAVGVCTDLSPAQLRTDDPKAWASSFEQSLPEGVDFCDLTGKLTELHESGEQVYYRSDHHWRTESAFACLPQVRKALGLDPAVSETEDLWKRTVVCTDLRGSLAAASGYSCRGEELAIYVPKEEIAYVVTNVSESTKKGSVYDLDALKSDDPYRVFLGGNPGELRIQTECAGKGRLLVFKDSYFNCFLPFLLRDYSQIDVIDPRFYSGDLRELFAGGSYDRVMYFYNVNSLSGDTSLSLIAGE